MDADTLIEGDGLQRMVRPFLTRRMSWRRRDYSGRKRIRGKARRVAQNPCSDEPLAGIQVVEYLRAFLFGRLGWNRLGGNIIISGAFGLFRREAVLNAGGYLHDTVGEDMELVLRLKRLSYEQAGPGRIAFVPDSVAWTQVPESARVLGRQRDRWHRGLADVLWRHRRMLFNPRYGVTGLVVLPYYVFVELLAPVVELAGLASLLLGLAFGIVDWSFAALFFLTAYGLGTALTAFTLIIEDLSFHRYDTFRDRAMLFWWALAGEPRLPSDDGLLEASRPLEVPARKKDWGAMERKGSSRCSTTAGA